MKRLLLSVLFILLVISMLLFIGFNIFSLLINKTNHMGLNTYALIGIYVVIGIITFLIYFVTWKSEFKTKPTIYLFILSICVLGILNIIIFEKLNIMMQYEIWLKKGMPEKFFFGS
jgi:hypothetical protein